MISVSEKNKWTYGTNSHSFLLYFTSEMCKALQDLPYHTRKQRKEFWIYTFFFFLNMKFYELHTVAGQDLGLNKLMNGFYCTQQIGEYERTII